MKETNAAIALLGKWPEKNLGFQRDSNPRPLCYRCSALPTKLSKPHESRRVMAAFASFILPLFNCYCWTYIIMEFILCPLNKKTLEYLLKTLCLAELTAFQITKLAQVFCWMNLAGKVWKTKDLNNWLQLCIKSIIIFPHRTWGVFLPKPQMYTSTILETPR